jgi:hypothetical protein
MERRDRGSLHPSIKHSETDMYRPRFEPWHSTKELSRQLNAALKLRSCVQHASSSSSKSNCAMEPQQNSIVCSSAQTRVCISGPDDKRTDFLFIFGRMGCIENSTSSRYRLNDVKQIKK